MDSRFSVILKLTFKVALAIWLSAISVWAIFTYFFIVYGWPLDKSSLQYSELNISPIITSLSKEAFIKRASPELLASLSDAELTMKLYNLSLLGRFKHRTGYIGHATFHLRGTNTAQYTANAVFENAQAQIEVYLIQHNDSWAISDLRFIVPVNGDIKTLRFTEETNENG